LVKNLRDIQKKLGEPIRKALQQTNFEEDIKDFLLKTNFFKEVIKFIQSKYKEYHDNKVTKEEVIQSTYLKYGHLFGMEGAKAIADIYCKDEKDIIQNYVKLQDYLIKHYSIEFFIQQQVEQNYNLIIDFKDSQIADYKTLSFSEFGNNVFEKRKLTLPGIGEIGNIYHSETLPSVFIAVNPNHKNKDYVYSMLALKRANTAVLFIGFMLEKQAQGVKADLEYLDMDIEKIKSTVLNYDEPGIDATLSKIISLENLVTHYADDLILPIKRFMDEVTPQVRNIEADAMQKVFNKDVKFDSIVGKAKFNPPAWFSNYLLSTQFVKIRQQVIDILSNIKEVQKILRELKEYLIKLKHEVKMRNLEKINEYADMISKLIPILGPILKKLIFSQ
jgi:hypothetical protein